MARAHLTKEPSNDFRKIESEKQYHKLVKDQILHKFYVRGYTFCGLVEALDGAFPTEVQTLLNSLVEEGTIVKDGETYLRKDMIKNPKKGAPSTLAISYNVTAEHLVVLPPKDEPTWEEFRIGRLRVKLRDNTQGDSEPLDIRPVIEESQIYNSVSRRSPHWRNIDLWSSDNTAYSLKGIRVVRECLGMLERGAAVGYVVDMKAQEYLLSNGQKNMLTNLLNEVKNAGQGVTKNLKSQV